MRDIYDLPVYGVSMNEMQKMVTLQEAATNFLLTVQDGGCIMGREEALKKALIDANLTCKAIVMRLQQ